MGTTDNKYKKPDLDPSHELPSPHDMELPAPHDMLIKPHITHKHSWLHWLPALIGLFIGLSVGVFFTKDAANNRNQINQYYTNPPSPSIASNNLQQANQPWQTYTNNTFGYSIKYPSNWKYSVNVDESLCCSSVIFRPLVDPSSDITDSMLDQLKQIGLLSVNINKSNQTTQEVISSICQDPLCEASIKSFNISGVNGWQASSPSALVSHTAVLQKNTPSDKLFKSIIATISLHKLAGNDPFASLSGEDRLKIYQQILSTFKFN